DDESIIQEVFLGAKLTFRVNLNKITDKGGSLISDCLSDVELSLITREIDFRKTFPALYIKYFEDYIFEQHKLLVRRQKEDFDSKNAVTMKRRGFDLQEGRFQLPNVPAELPGFFAKSHEYHREFILLHALRKSPESRQTIEKNYTHMAVSLFIQSRVSLYLFYEKNREEICRLRWRVFGSQAG